MLSILNVVSTIMSVKVDVHAPKYSVPKHIFGQRKSIQLKPLITFSKFYETSRNN